MFVMEISAVNDIVDEEGVYWPVKKFAAEIGRVRIHCISSIMHMP